MKEGRPRKGFIKDEQFALLAANAKTPWLRCFIECAYKFGFRKGELLGLRRRQVDLLEGRIRLEDSKRSTHHRFRHDDAPANAGPAPRQEG